MPGTLQITSTIEVSIYGLECQYTDLSADVWTIEVVTNLTGPITCVARHRSFWSRVSGDNKSLLITASGKHMSP
jgi:hypothetical protein